MATMKQIKAMHVKQAQHSVAQRKAKKPRLGVAYMDGKALMFPGRREGALRFKTYRKTDVGDLVAKHAYLFKN